MCGWVGGGWFSTCVCVRELCLSVGVCVGGGWLSACVCGGWLGVCVPGVVSGWVDVCVWEELI